MSEPKPAPMPMYRHAMPSGPWPWINFNEDFKPGPTQPLAACGESWKGYPQRIFPNWTPEQVKRSKMLLNCPQEGRCTIYNVDVMMDGNFVNNTPDEFEHNINDAQWAAFQEKRPDDIRVRALFVDKMTVPILQMLGTKYIIEPFFFTSSTNWIPSHYQEEVKPREGDHITITLPFIRALKPSTFESATPSGSIDSHQVIDTTRPLYLNSASSRHMLMLDLFSVHMVRMTKSSTIISYSAADSDHHRTNAERMKRLFLAIGQSVYWQKIFTRTKDPTFVLLSMLWYALYAWDESFETLYAHINSLESSVMTTNETRLTGELHIIQAHLLFYAILLQDFTNSTKFIEKTPHPGMFEDLYEKDLLGKECQNLISAIERLERIRDMHSKRLQNVMNLAFATVNIEDSKQMKGLTEATLKDSTAMKQIAYLSMIFLPANFMASVFGMNIGEINPGTKGTVAHYVIATVSLTLFTVWLVVALQRDSHFHGPDGQGKTILNRVCWPILAIRRTIMEKNATRIGSAEAGRNRFSVDLDSSNDKSVL